MTNSIVYLKVSNYSGISIGAKHYYGKLVGDLDGGETKRVELFKKLTTQDVLEYNKLERRAYSNYRYSAGDDSKGFLDYTAVIAEAKRRWRKEFPGAVVLMEGSNTIADPQHILVVRGTHLRTFKKKVNALYCEHNAIDGYEGNPKRAEELYREYRARC